MTLIFERKRVRDMELYKVLYTKGYDDKYTQLLLGSLDWKSFPSERPWRMFSLEVGLDFLSPWYIIIQNLMAYRKNPNRQLK